MSRIDRSSLKKLSAQERKDLKRDLAAADRAPEAAGKPPAPRRGPSVGFMLVYGLLCAGGGVYFDRHLLPKTRMWFGDQVQALSGFGSEQAILGMLEQAGTSTDEQDVAMGNVRRVYRAHRQGSLDPDQLEQLAEAEVVLQASQQTGHTSQKDLARMLELYAHLAAEL